MRPLGRLHVPASMVPQIRTLLSVRMVLECTGEVCLRLTVVEHAANHVADAVYTLDQKVDHVADADSI